MKNNKKIICFCVLFLVIAILTLFLYKYCKEFNNRLCDEILKIPLENSLLGRNDEIISKAELYHKLANIFKYVSIGNFSTSLILCCIMCFKRLKSNM